MNAMDNWGDTDLARDIAIWRESGHPPLETGASSSRQSPEEQAIQVWLDDGGSDNG
jgi:hypothetical protein